VRAGPGGQVGGGGGGGGAVVSGGLLRAGRDVWFAGIRAVRYASR